MVRALYPGTFDPVTNGHLDITIRAARLFDEVIVAVYDAPPKQLLFSTEERVALYRAAIAERGLTNVSVISYRGLTVRTAAELGCQVVVRGIRALGDFLYEADMAITNRTLAPEIELVFLMTLLEYSYISSSRVKELAALGEQVEAYVPPAVAAAMAARLGRH
ncbi:MAG: pantetheine-phosphate adenylyltransferase [Chloroflexi bacterium]|nr:pantetheine-phosphate adenylyltransferase [Chloroflexota bacterium]GIW10627.1 MAG: phosphopantetheine adenylyltransferase [Dehalococcoidia bacterium]